jgi:hypothetical protein
VKSAATDVSITMAKMMLARFTPRSARASRAASSSRLINIPSPIALMLAQCNLRRREVRGVVVGRVDGGRGGVGGGLDREPPPLPPPPRQQ